MESSNSDIDKKSILEEIARDRERLHEQIARENKQIEDMKRDLDNKLERLSPSLRARIFERRGIKTRASAKQEGRSTDVRVTAAMPKEERIPEPKGMSSEWPVAEPIDDQPRIHPPPEFWTVDESWTEEVICNKCTTCTLALLSLSFVGLIFTGVFSLLSESPYISEIIAISYVLEISFLFAIIWDMGLRRNWKVNFRVRLDPDYLTLEADGHEAKYPTRDLRIRKTTQNFGYTSIGTNKVIWLRTGKKRGRHMIVGETPTVTVSVGSGPAVQYVEFSCKRISQITYHLEKLQGDVVATASLAAPLETETATVLEHLEP